MAWIKKITKLNAKSPFSDKKKSFLPSDGAVFETDKGELNKKDHSSLDLLVLNLPYVLKIHNRNQVFLVFLYLYFAFV